MPLSLSLCVSVFVIVCLFKKGEKRRDPPRTGKRLVEVGCFLPTLDKERVTGWLEENDVSWKEVLDVVKVIKVSSKESSTMRHLSLSYRCRVLAAQILVSHSVSI